jgi:type II secretory pathway pseudopilin PulG
VSAFLPSGEEARLMGRKVSVEAAIAIACILLALAMLFGLFGSGWVRSSADDQKHFDQLMRIKEALEAYAAETGHWPKSLEELKARSPDLALPPAAGPNRVEYYGGPAPNGLLFRSLGHKASQRGRNSEYGDVYWEVYVDGRVVEKELRDHRGP